MGSRTVRALLLCSHCGSSFLDLYRMRLHEALKWPVLEQFQAEKDGRLLSRFTRRGE